MPPMFVDDAPAGRRVPPPDGRRRRLGRPRERDSDAVSATCSTRRSRRPPPASSTASYWSRRVRITRVDAMPLAVPLAAGVPLGGRCAGRRQPRPLRRPHRRRRRRVRASRSARCPRRSPRTAGDGAPVRRHSPGDVEAILRAIWSEGRWKTSPQFTQFVFSGIEVACWDALGRALGVPTRTFFGGTVHEELDFFGFLQGDDPATLAAARARARRITR